MTRADKLTLTFPNKIIVLPPICYLNTRGRLFWPHSTPFPSPFDGIVAHHYLQLKCTQLLLGQPDVGTPLSLSHLQTHKHKNAHARTHKYAYTQTHSLSHKHALYTVSPSHTFIHSLFLSYSLLGTKYGWRITINPFFLLFCLFPLV